MTDTKLHVIGLDCATPSLFFDRHVDNIPAIKRFQAAGTRGQLRSSDPPITIPAWMCMATGKTPGQLGIYGFRHRRENSYKDIWIASSRRVRAKRIWDFVAEAGGKSCLVGVPPSYPPFPVEGWLVGGFITPDTNRNYTYPEGLAQGEHDPDALPVLVEQVRIVVDQQDDFVPSERSLQPRIVVHQFAVGGEHVFDRAIEFQLPSEPGGRQHQCDSNQ